MKNLDVDSKFLISTLKHLLQIPSPTGYTDQAVHAVGDILTDLNVPFELTRRGAIRATLKGAQESPDRALVAHLDTLGSMVKVLKDDGRIGLCAIGTWPSRFAEGARVSIFTKKTKYHGTVLPLKASGHIYGEKGVNNQATSWRDIEIRLDEKVHSQQDLLDLGIRVGDFIAYDPGTEVLDNGFVVSRHLDNKVGVSILLTIAKMITQHGIKLPVDCHLLFTISEEVGSGASAILHQDVAEMVAVDNATNAPKHASSDYGVTIAMMDSTGPFDYHLTNKLLDLCEHHRIPYARDVFNDYRCDAAAAIEAGNDLRTALACFAVDSSHGYERSHIESMTALAKLLSFYVQSGIIVKHDRYQLGPLKGFPEQPM